MVCVPDPAISVIVPTRNRAHYLGETLRTLAAQETEAAFEVVVVDNGSTDDTSTLMESWCRQDARFKCVREPHAGLSRAKNAGIRAARAPLLLFTDDDMRIDRHWIESYRKLFVEYQGMLVIAGGKIVPIAHDLGDWPSWLDEAALTDVGLLNHQNKRPLQKFEYVWGGNMAVPRFVFDLIGIWDENAGLQAEQRVTKQDTRFYEDTEFQDRVEDVAGSTWFCPDAVVYHRIDRRSVTPRQVCSNAFSRGRHDFWQNGLRRWYDVERFPKRNAIAAGSTLGWNLARWGFWLLLFRFFKRKTLFERARHAAFASGRSADALRAGRAKRHPLSRVARFAIPTRTLLLRLTPDVA